jgi:hypothetical protein
MSPYLCDDSLAYWKNNVAIESILEDFSFRQDDAIAMRGHFESGILGDHTYSFTFTPNHDDEPAIIFPVRAHGRLVDILAIATHDHRIFGCVTGQGQFVGDFSNAERTDRTSPLVVQVHDTPDSCLAGEGVLPLAKSFYPLLNFADFIVARSAEHAEKLANAIFIYPAERFGLDVHAAERAANERISF